MRDNGSDLPQDHPEKAQQSSSVAPPISAYVFLSLSSLVCFNALMALIFCVVSLLKPEVIPDRFFAETGLTLIIFFSASLVQFISIKVLIKCYKTIMTPSPAPAAKL